MEKKRWKKKGGEEEKKKKGKILDIIGLWCYDNKR